MLSLLIAAFYLLPGVACFAQNSPATEPVLDVDTVRVKVSPDLEFVLPYGVIVQQAQLTVGQMVLGTRAEFNLPESAVGGEVSILRRFGKWEPRLVGYQDLNSESIVSPRLTNGEISIVPGEEYTKRVRGANGRLRYYVSDRLYVSGGSSFVESIETRFVDSVTVAEAQQRSYLITPMAGVTISSLKVRRPRLSSRLTGAYARFEVDQVFSGSIDHPVAATAGSVTLWHHQIQPRVSLAHQASFTTPLRVWDEALFLPPLIGGFDTVRGFNSRYLAATRGVILRNTATWIPKGTLDVTVNTPVIGSESKVPLRIHDVGALLVGDAAIVQKGIRMDGDLDAVLGSGPGVALTISAGDSVHFDISTYAVWPVGVSSVPVFYLQGSLFSYSSR